MKSLKNKKQTFMLEKVVGVELSLPGDLDLVLLLKLNSRFINCSLSSIFNLPFAYKKKIRYQNNNRLINQNPKALK